MVIELFKCKDCWRVVDQFLPPNCPCMSKWSVRVNPTKFNLIKWFLANPKHVIKLLVQDFHE